MVYTGPDTHWVTRYATTGRRFVRVVACGVDGCTQASEVIAFAVWHPRDPSLSGRVP